MPRYLQINNAILFLCCSIYLGTGVSILFFHLPLEPRLTPDNYALPFLEPVARATVFFTWMTMVMLVTGVIMLVTEWFSGLRWVPIVVLLGVIGASLVTVWLIFPYNQRLNEGITDPEELRHIFRQWVRLNWFRSTFWALEWAAMMAWYAAMAARARADR